MQVVAVLLHYTTITGQVGVVVFDFERRYSSLISIINISLPQVYDITNSSPAFRAPSQFTVMTGCENQVIELNPVDPDGDTVRCRWATSTEAADWPV